jgi:hypothetical protein
VSLDYPGLFALGTSDPLVAMAKISFGFLVYDKKLSRAGGLENPLELIGHSDFKKPCRCESEPFVHFA